MIGQPALSMKTIDLTTPHAVNGAGAALALLAVTGLFAPVLPVHAGSERIFANGFEPCCQIGGTVSGLVGSGLVLQLDAGASSEGRPIVGNGLYRFAANVAPGTAYSIGITGQPDSQTCTLSISGGSMGSADVENANVACGGNLIWDQGNWGEPWR